MCCHVCRWECMHRSQPCSVCSRCHACKSWWLWAWHVPMCWRSRYDSFASSLQVQYACFMLCPQNGLDRSFHQLTELLSDSCFAITVQHGWQLCKLRSRSLVCRSDAGAGVFGVDRRCQLSEGGAACQCCAVTTHSGLLWVCCR